MTTTPSGDDPLPPIPPDATGWDYERLNSTINLIMALDTLLRLLDEALKQRGVSEEARIQLLDQLAKWMEPFADPTRLSDMLGPVASKQAAAEFQKVINVLLNRHLLIEDPLGNDPLTGTWIWQCIRCGHFPANLRQGCLAECGLHGWLKRVPA